MNEKPYFVNESFFPKAEHFDDVLNILKETSEMIKEQEGILMHLVLNPEQKKRTNFSNWSLEKS